MSEQDRAAAQALLHSIDRSPSPWHAVANQTAQLEAQGFERLSEAEPWQLRPGQGYYVVRDGSSIIAFRIGDGRLAEHGFRMVGAHTDSPGLRVKPHGPHARGLMVGLGVEVYGGPILATFADRDLTLAGRAFVREGNAMVPRLYHCPHALVRLPNAAIHLNRSVNEEGLKFDRQEELPLMLAVLQEGLPPEAHFRRLLAEALDCAPEAVVSWSLAAADTQPGAFFGPRGEFIASARLDNLASCHAAQEALLSAEGFPGVTLCAFFDHEEVGSESHKGAASNFLQSVVVRVADGLGATGEEYHRALARSWLLSVDMAHAYHPNYARFYDAQHPAVLNGGPVLKLNANQRYATNEWGEAYFQALCERAEVPGQVYVHRTNLPCGSTIGPITAARLGVRTIDIGNPMWSMHSARESAGTWDHARMIRLLHAFFTDPESGGA